MTNDQFRQARIKLGLTQKQLGRLMALSQARLSDIERGVRQPTKGHAAHIKNLSAWKAGKRFPTE